MIRTMFKLATAVLVVVALAALPGCGGSNPPAATSPTGHYEGDGHDHSKDEAGHHEGDGHDHEMEGQKAK
jgi:major membrane immunogen (membrane-anchored lipoprotein)